MKSIDLTVVGVAFEGRQRLLEGLSKTPGVLEARLRRDPENEFDCNAILVDMRRVSDEGETFWEPVGFMPASLASKFAPRLDAGMKVNITACSVYGGTHGKSYGASITFEYEWPMQEAS